TCEHRLYPKDLFPIFSWVFLGGKCRYCKEKISPRYLIVEAIVGVSGVLLYHFYTLPQAGLLFAVFCILLCITLIDADTMEIPDSLNVAIVLCGILAIFAFPEVSLLSRVIGIFAISVPLFLISLFIAGAFGFGDVKLMLGAGFLLGWQHELVGFFIALILGGIYGAALLIRKKKGGKDHFAFGPCLAVGIFAALLTGQELIDWYLALMHL
ncbi:MAG: A24 family peptidase, partial [Clostridiales Family XIII bacterium]|nr:A24 family peptidase [Clostridiales Family XIII bacterium]